MYKADNGAATNGKPADSERQELQLEVRRYATTGKRKREEDDGGATGSSSGSGGRGKGTQGKHRDDALRGRDGGARARWPHAPRR